MKTARLNAWILGITIVGLCLGLVDAVARAGSGGSGLTPVPELSATYGSTWGGHIDTGLGEFRLGTGGSWGLALDVPLRSGTAMELSYTRQNGSLDFDNLGVTTLTDMSIDYWQIGSLQALASGPVIPFVLGSLGATYYSPDKKTITVEDETYHIESATKFSFNFGLGFKTYFGDAKRVGLRASLKVMPTFYDTSSGMWFGSGGGGVTVSGSSIWQYEAAGGLTVRLGR